MSDGSKHNAGTRRTRYSIVRSFCRWLTIDQAVRADPCVGVATPKVPRSVPRALGADDAAALWAGLPDARARVIVGLMLFLGLRRAEVVGLQVADWDRRAELVTVVGKGGHVRVLPVPERLRREMVAYCTLGHGPIVRREDGYGPIGVERVSHLVRTWMVAAGIKHTALDGRACHSLRHTLASNVADIEPDLRVIQAILGHVSLTSTQIYLRRAEMGIVRAVLDTVA